MPEIMSLFVFQNSRWQHLTYLMNVINELSESASTSRGKEASRVERRRDNLSRAANAVKRHITGPSLLDGNRGALLNLTPSTEKQKYWHMIQESPKIQPLARLGTIKGIPEEVDINHEGHIY